MEKCAQSVLSDFPVFALGIWTLRYEPLVSGSSCSLFGCTFLAQCLVRLWIHVLRLQIPWCSSWVGRRHVRWCATTGLRSDSGENWFRSCSSLLVDILIPMVQTIQQIIEIHRCCPYLVVDVPGVRVAQILRCKCGGDSRLPQLQLLRIPSRFRACSWTRLLTCLCCSTTGAWSLGAENCGSPQLQCVSQWEVPQMQFIACFGGHPDCTETGRGCDA